MSAAADIPESRTAQVFARPDDDQSADLFGRGEETGDEVDGDEDERREDAVQTMLEWFRARFEDPAQRTPYESAEGGYIWIWGGPFDADEELQSEFGGEYPEEWVREAVEELEKDCVDWAPVPSEDDYDRSLFDVVESNSNPLATLEKALATVESLLAIGPLTDLELSQALNRLLFANCITALETYLSDTFINGVLPNAERVQKLLDTSPQFKSETVPIKNVLREASAINGRVKRYLLDIVWHNVAKVHALYRDVYGVHFGPASKEVAAAVPTRHDIVHRNGRTKDGEDVVVTRAEVLSLRDSVARMAREVEALMPDRAHAVAPPRHDDDLPF